MVRCLRFIISPYTKYLTKISTSQQSNIPIFKHFNSAISPHPNIWRTSYQHFHSSVIKANRLARSKQQACHATLINLIKRIGMHVLWILHQLPAMSGTWDDCCFPAKRTVNGSSSHRFSSFLHRLPDWTLMWSFFFISDSILSILSCKVNEVSDLRSLIWMFIAAANSLIKRFSKIWSQTRAGGQWMHALIFFNTACRVLVSTQRIVYIVDHFPTCQSSIWI